MAHFCLVFVFSCALLRGGDILMLGAREVVNITMALPVRANILLYLNYK